MNKKVIDILVKCNNPKALDQTLQSLGSALVQNYPDVYMMIEECYIARCFGNADFVKFAITQQGYGKVVRELEQPEIPGDLANEAGD